MLKEKNLPLTAEKRAQYMEMVRAHNEGVYARSGHRPAAFTHHYGCQQNVSDGEKIDGMLAEMGYGKADGPDTADVVIYNTCAVRENAENRIYGNVGALIHAKRRNPDMIVGLCGCMVQQEHVAQKIKNSFRHVDLLFGPSALPDFPRMLYRKLVWGDRVFERRDETGAIVEDLPVRRDGAVRAWVPVMYGCNNFCTYCVVPYVRGRERSREADRIAEEVRGLIGDGYREFTLLGQNVNSYRDGETDFKALLRRLNALPGDFRIRFMTSHPKDCSRELIDAIADCEKVCNHLHLPVQSGSDRILGAMNRGYTAAEYLDTISYARKKIPDITFTGDIIVGFPGETYEDFQETLKLVRAARYQSLFTFLYSAREGTKAADMDDPVSHEEKMRRFQELLDFQNTVSRSFYDGCVGKTLRVLLDGPGKSGPGWLCGRTESNMIVEAQAPAAQIGQFCRVNITRSGGWMLGGEYTEE